jgi:uncharacterized membrane protein
MEALVVLGVLVPIALLILLAVNIGRMSALQREVRQLREQMQDFMRVAARGGTVPAPPPAAATVAKPVPPPPIVAAPAEEPKPAVPIEEPTPPPLMPVPPVVKGPAMPIPPSPVPVRDLHEEVRQATEERQRAAAFSAPRAIPISPPQPPRPSFLERNPDLEKFIGENLINKIGIASLVIGLGFLLNWAIDRDYLSNTALTLIGLASGGLLLFFAHRLREKFRAFASVLVGGGLAVLYFSIAFAYQQYHLIGQTAAFIIMVVITGLGVLLTLVYDRKELAVIAMLGGFASPFMASSGEGDFKVLFTYLLILNAGMLVLANYKKWHLINIIAFALTAIIYGGWLGLEFLDMSPRPVWPALAFATGFFLVFFGMNLRYDLKHGSEFGPLDFSLLLVNTAAYFAAGMSVLNALEMRINGLFVVALALFHLVFAVYLYKRSNTSRYLVLLLIGLVLTFISLAAPVQLKGNHITLFWSAECVLLLWFSQRTGIKLVQRASLLVLALMLISLGMDLTKYYGADPLVRLTPLLNEPWITGMVSAIALWLYARLLKTAATDDVMIPGIEPLSSHAVRRAVLVFTGIVLYCVNLFEISHQLGFVLDRHVTAMALTAYTLLTFSLVYVLTRQANVKTRGTVVVLIAIALLFFITGHYRHSTSAMMGHRVGSALAVGAIPFFFVSLCAVIITLVCLIQLMRSLLDRRSAPWNAYLWGICIYLVILSSQVVDNVLLLTLSPAAESLPAGEEANAGYMHFALMDALRSVRKAAYPLLWGLSSFIFMWYGMRTRQRTVRIIALSLFGLTLVKLFVIDVWDLSEGGRVAAFICLGILLLVVSFMYNKLKGLLLEDDPSVARSADPPAEQAPLA